MGEIVEIKRGGGGNGAREAIQQYFGEIDPPNDGTIQPLGKTDHMLATLWKMGFKVVPLDKSDEEAYDPWDIPTMQRTHFASWVQRKLWAVVEMPNGMWQVYCQTHDGVGPPSEYPTLRKAAARLLQLFGCGAVAPQTWPESVCIGFVKTDDSGDDR